MMFTREEIDNWIAIGLAGDNQDKNSIFAKEMSLSLKRDLLEMKILVDRWDLLTTDFVFHSLIKPLIRDNIKNGLESTDDSDIDEIWGTKIHYTDLIPISKALVLDLGTKPFSNRHVAVFEVNLQHLQRIANLKAFW